MSNVILTSFTSNSIIGRVDEVVKWHQTKSIRVYSINNNNAPVILAGACE